MRVLVTGASGYVGGRLVPELLDAGHEVRCYARTPAKLDGFAWRPDVEVASGDVIDVEATAAALADCDAAYYLVHSMGGAAAVAEHDRRAAAAFRDAAARTPGLRRIVFLGGLGDDADPDLSHHLRSRHEVGQVLAHGPVPVTELRAAVIIGSGSASFEMLRHLVDVLPVMVCPKWVRTRCQPIAVRDVLHHLVAAVDLEGEGSRILEIGGPDVLTYLDMMRIYAEVAGLPRRLVLPVPLLTPRLSSLWIGLVTPLPAALARPLIDSLVNDVVVRTPSTAQLGPYDPVPFRRSVELALRRVEDLDVLTTWAGAGLSGTPADPLPTDPSWAGGTVLKDERDVDVDASAADVHAVVAGIGGDRGWLVADWLWEARGWVDRLAGGVGLRRGRRHPDEVRVGDAVDFWRVEANEPGRLLRLRAEMRLPGDAWLEWRIDDRPGGGSTLHQRALFHPRGVWGRAYWYALLPFHALIFAPLARRIAALAAERAARRRQGAVSAETPDAVSTTSSPSSSSAKAITGPRSDASSRRSTAGSSAGTARIQPPQ